MLRCLLLRRIKDLCGHRRRCIVRQRVSECGNVPSEMEERSSVHVLSNATTDCTSQNAERMRTKMSSASRVSGNLHESGTACILTLAGREGHTAPYPNPNSCLACDSPTTWRAGDDVVSRQKLHHSI